MTLGERLADLRKQAKLTQAELGKQLNISAQAISKWENDMSEPDVPTIRKLSEIYNVSSSYIIDGENANFSEQNTVIASEDDTKEQNGLLDSLFDVYLTEIDKDKKIATINHLMNLIGIDLVEANRAVENLPFCISGMLYEETAKNIEEYFKDVGAKVTFDTCKGMQKRKTILSLKKPEPPKESHDMRKRFIVANLTAGIPGLILMIILFADSASFGDVLLALYLGISVYTVIFLLWYPTLTRKLLSPIRSLSFEGFFGTIGSCVLFLIFLPWLILVTLISPINYIFAIKTRIRRMIDEDDEDDIFTIEFEKEMGFR